MGSLLTVSTKPAASTMKTVPTGKPSALAIVGAGMAAIGASICCVVPLVLVLMGISGAWIANLTALDRWRPWFTAATVLCLVVAFWHLYGPASRCRTDGSCVEPRTLAQRRRWLWSATVVIALLLLFPYYIGWFL
jgi:mercuric ion transport protein